MNEINSVPESALTAMVHDALMRGMLRPQVEAAVAEQCERHNLTQPASEALDAAYAQCVDLWMDEANRPDAAIYAWHIAARRDVYQKSYLLNDYKTCAGVLKDLAQLEQQYKRERKRSAEDEKTTALRDRIRHKSGRLRSVK